MGKAARVKKIRLATTPLKLDFGCGSSKREGFQGVDALDFPGVDFVVDLRVAPWPWPDNSVDEAVASHFVEHLTAQERVTFANELYRVLKPNAGCQMITPHWASHRAYGDPTHLWPPVSEMWFYYLNREWRKTQAPHTDILHNPNGFNCHFDAQWGYNESQMPDFRVRNLEWKQFAFRHYKDAIDDIVANLQAVK